MPYDEYTAERITRILEERKVPFYSKPMMGGLVFMVDEKMCCGLLFNKKHNSDTLMVRIGEEATEKHATEFACKPMDFVGRPFKGYLFVLPEGYDSEEDLDYWVNLCLAFNPLAKASKKRVKK